MTFDATQRATLAALADVFVPSVRPPAAQPTDPHGFWGLTASATGAPARVADLLPQLVDEEELEGLRTLLKVLRAAGVGRLPRGASVALLRALGAADEEAADAIEALRQLTMMAHYGGVDASGRNPTWSALGYPGPPDVTDDREPLPLLDPTGDEVELEADVVVVGSGSGGGVVAATLAAAGRDVLVLEAGDAVAPADLPGDEARALQELYWRAGTVTTDDGNVAILAGRTLGGGSTVNWSNCVPPPAHVLQEWAEAGVDGADGPDMADHLQAVAQRMGVTDEGTEVMGPNAMLRDGAKALGWSWHPTARNVDTDREDPRATGATGLGDRAGAKQGSLQTWLPDAVAQGARILTGCTAQRVLVERGRAAGVVGTRLRDGRQQRVTVRAREVVVACGALETPALLLRSGIGGPAVGQHLRLHPVPVLLGVYDHPQDVWLGPPQGVVVGERSDVADGYGYLLETPHYHPGLLAASVSWPARAHKLLMGRFDRIATFIAVTRERGGGRVTLDEAGEGVVEYPLDDSFDRWLLQQGVRDIVRLHVAAGALAIADPAPGQDVWRRGDDVEAFADRIAAKPMGKESRVLFSAHQMGSARIGTDPTTSVADGDGQLHDTPGVWIGDTSLFPSAVGSNPMLTTMAMARRTATRLLALT